MALMDILAQAQGGAFYANVGQATGIAPEEARNAMTALCPVIAVKLRKRAEDEETFDALLDIIEDGDGDAFLDDPALTSDPEVIKDGNAILADVYGTKAAALKDGQALAPALSKTALASVMAIAASSVLAALARGQRQPLAVSGVQTAMGGGGLLGTIVSSVLEGAIKGAVRELTPRPKRRRRSYASSRRRRSKTRTRRTARPSLDSIFREILGSIR